MRHRLAVAAVAAVAAGSAFAVTHHGDPGGYTAAAVARSLQGQLATHGHPGLTVTCPPPADRPAAVTICTTSGPEVLRVAVTRDEDRRGWSWQVGGAG